MLSIAVPTTIVRWPAQSLPTLRTRIKAVARQITLLIAALPHTPATVVDALPKRVGPIMALFPTT